MAANALASVALLLLLTLLNFTFGSCDSSSNSALDDSSRKTWGADLTQDFIDELQSIEDSLISFDGNLTNPVLKEPVEALITSLSSLIQGLANADITDPHSITSVLQVLKSVLGSLSWLIKELLKTFDIPTLSKFVRLLKPLIDLLLFFIKVIAPEDYVILRLLKFLLHLVLSLIKKLAIFAPHLAAELQPTQASLSLLVKALAKALGG